MARVLLSCFAVLAHSAIEVPVNIVAKFEEFEHHFGKNYAASERGARLVAFSDNLGIISALQASERGSAIYSHLTPFADLTPEELATRKGYLPSWQGNLEIPAVAAPLSMSLPTDFDWVAKGAVNPIKNQMSCGSCWAFAAVVNLEGAAFLASGKLLALSEQQLVECDTDSGDLGCTGGLPEYALKHLIKDKAGLETEDDYPYVGGYPYIEKCHKALSKEKVFVGNSTFLSKDEGELAAWLVQHGPIAIGINSIAMATYFSGVANPDPTSCKPATLDHGVAIVGFGVDADVKYWKIRNSWGTLWGEKGYYRIVRGTGACGLNTAAVTALAVTVKGGPGPSPSPPPGPPSPTPPTPPAPPSPTPPAPGPKPIPGDCISQKAKAACVGTETGGELCTWCDFGTWGDCMPPAFHCGGKQGNVVV